MFKKVFDDIIDEVIQDEIENLLFDVHCPWFYHPQTVLKKQIEGNIKKFNLSNNVVKNMIDNQMFVHSIVDGDNIKCTKTGPVVAKMLMQFSERSNFSIENLYRVKANLQLRDGNFTKEHYNTIHCDNDGPHWAMIYYVNDTDGDTLFFNSNEIIDRVSPKKGRILLFDGSIMHASQLPQKTINRCILNLNIQMKEGDGNGS